MTPERGLGKSAPSSASAMAAGQALEEKSLAHVKSLAAGAGLPDEAGTLCSTREKSIRK